MSALYSPRSSRNSMNSSSSTLTSPVEVGELEVIEGLVAPGVEDVVVVEVEEVEGGSQLHALLHSSLDGDVIILLVDLSVALGLQSVGVALVDHFLHELHGSLRLGGHH